MFGVQPAVPVDLRVVEAECAVFLADFDVEVVDAGEELVAEGAEFGFVPDVVDFVDYGADGGVLVHEDFGDEVFEREVGFADVEVGWEGVSVFGFGDQGVGRHTDVSDYAEADWDLFL